MPARLGPVALLLAVCLLPAAVASRAGSVAGNDAADSRPHPGQTARSAPGSADGMVTRTVPLPAGRTLSIAITVGSVRIAGEARDDAVIEVRRTAPAADGVSRLPVTIDEQPGAVSVRAVQADGGTSAAFRTDVTVRVPRAATIETVRIVEGPLSLAGLVGRIAAEVQRGAIDATDVAGTLRLETVIGDITATRAHASPGGLLRLRTFNGNVRLLLAERPANARILALALNGTIASAIPLTLKDTWGPRWGEATLGSGDPVISLDVVTGRIEIATAK